MTPLKPIEELLPQLVRMDKRKEALSNWEIISRHLVNWSEENKRALAATILVETATTFEPIKELGTDAYFIRNYWRDKSVREALGNIFEHDAVEYCGKGFIQVTGRNNYMRCACALNLPLMSHPELLLQPEPSARAAVWFWDAAKIAPLSDSVRQYIEQPLRDKIWTQVRRKVNGGTKGLDAFLANLSGLEVR